MIYHRICYIIVLFLFRWWIQLNRAKDLLLSTWERVPWGLRHKPMDALVCILLIMYALSIGGVSIFDPFDFLSANLTLAYLIEIFVAAYLVLGSAMILIGLLSHHTHNSLLSFCGIENCGWRLVFSACSVILIAEMINGPSLAVFIWLLQTIAALFKIIQYYAEGRLEQKIWSR